MYHLKKCNNSDQLEKILWIAKIIEQNKIMKQYHYHNAMNAISKNTYENNLAASVSKKSNKETIIYNKDGDAEKVLEFLKIFK